MDLAGDLQSRLVTPTTTAALYYDPSVSSSYPESGTSVTNIGTGGTMTGTLNSVSYTSSGGGYFTFSGSTSSYINFASAFNFGTSVTFTAWVNAVSQFSIRPVRILNERFVSILLFIFSCSSYKIFFHFLHK